MAKPGTDVVLYKGPRTPKGRETKPEPNEIPFARKLRTEADDAWSKAQELLGRTVPAPSRPPAAPSGPGPTRPADGVPRLDTQDRTPRNIPWGAMWSNTSSLRAPTVSGGGFSVDRVFAARLIILSCGVSGVAIIIKSATRGDQPTVVNVGTDKVKVPANLRAFAGVVLAGTVALIVNELSPDLGLLLGVGLLFIAFANADIYKVLGGAVAGKLPATGTAPNATYTDPKTGKKIVTKGPDIGKVTGP